MTAVFAGYLKTFADAADAAAAAAAAAAVAEGAAVIVEPRRHPALRAVVANHRAMLPPAWPIRLWTSHGNVAHALAELRGIPGPLEVRALAAGVADLTQLSYSELLMSSGFWESQKEPWILIFQTDCVMFRPLAGAELARWQRYDYVGANYYNAAEVAPGGVGGVQGGFSLRRRDAMLECLARVRWDDVDAWRAAGGGAAVGAAPPIAESRRFEDIYYTHACAIIGAALPPPSERGEFSVEAERPAPAPAPPPIAHHGWNRPYFSDAQARELLAAAAAAGAGAAGAA
jgi:hypothetical protein